MLKACPSLTRCIVIHEKLIALILPKSYELTLIMRLGSPPLAFAIVFVAIVVVVVVQRRIEIVSSEVNDDDDGVACRSKLKE